MFKFNKEARVDFDLFQKDPGKAFAEYEKQKNLDDLEVNFEVAQLNSKIDDYNNKSAWFRTAKEYKALAVESNKLIDAIQKYENPDKIFKHLNQWRTSTLARLDAEGGDFINERKAAVENLYMVAQEKGFMIANDKLEHRALVEGNSEKAKIQQAFQEKNLAKALELRENLEAYYVKMGAVGVFDKDQVQAYSKNLNNQFANTAIMETLEENSYLEISQSADAARKDYANKKKIFSDLLKHADTRVQTQFLTRGKLLKKKQALPDVNAFERDFTNTMSDFRFGTASASEALKATDTFKRQLQSLVNNKNIKPSSRSRMADDIKMLSVTGKAISAVIEASDEQGKGVFSLSKNVLFDPTATPAEIVNKLGLSNVKGSAKAIHNFRRTYLPFYSQDSALTFYEMRNFLKRQRGEEVKEYDGQSSASILARAEEVRLANFEMTGKDAIDVRSAEELNMLYSRGDEEAVKIVDKLAQNMPETFKLARQHKENRIWHAVNPLTTLPFLKANQDRLQMSEGQMRKLHGFVSSDNKAAAVFNKYVNKARYFIENDSTLQKLVNTGTTTPETLSNVLAARAFYPELVKNRPAGETVQALEFRTKTGDKDIRDEHWEGVEDMFIELSRSFSEDFKVARNVWASDISIGFSPTLSTAKKPITKGLAQLFSANSLLADDTPIDRQKVYTEIFNMGALVGRTQLRGGNVTLLHHNGDKYRIGVKTQDGRYQPIRSSRLQNSVSNPEGYIMFDASYINQALTKQQEKNPASWFIPALKKSNQF